MKNQLKENIYGIIKKSHCALTRNAILDKINEKVSKTALKKALDELRHEGKIVTSKKGKIMVTEKSDHISAEIISHSKNFSFAKSLYSNEEIFISKHDVRNAILGDYVLVGKINRSEKGLSGVVKKIIKDGHHTVTGRTMKGLSGLELVCDSAIRYNLSVPKGYSMGAKMGDKVKAVLSRGVKDNKLYAKIIKIYGKSESAKICADAVIDANDIPSVFSESVINSANKISSFGISEKEINSRVDLRNEIIFTIDGEDAKDLDDAISIKKLSAGWELGVHIADVSYYVKENTEIDQEALSRGTSVYFANRVIPMLPEAISNGVCSLNQGEDKLTLSAIINLDKAGTITGYKFIKSIINTKVRGVYSEVNSIFNNTALPQIRKKYEIVLDSVKHAKELSDILDKRAQDRGIVEISSTESKFILDANGKCVDIHRREQGISEKIIENFMIAANCSAAKYAKNKGIPFVYRIHEEPESLRVENLAKLAGLLGLKANKIRSGLKPSDLSELLAQAKDTSTKRIISHQILRTMAKAKYDSEPLGHFGLSLADYCHFTSPIRRYPDICVHRILSDIICGLDATQINDKYTEKTAEHAKQSTFCEIRAMQSERDAEKYYMAEFMFQHVGEFYNGIVSGVSSKGIFVELENTVDGFMDLSYYKGCHFIFDGMLSYVDTYSHKKISIGDNLKVKVVAVNISSATIDFAPAEIFDEE